jgi:2-(3-amino-3-carboxypropyl)histidine synthase
MIYSKPLKSSKIFEFEISSLDPSPPPRKNTSLNTLRLRFGWTTMMKNDTTAVPTSAALATPTASAKDFNDEDGCGIISEEEDSGCIEKRPVVSTTPHSVVVASEQQQQQQPPQASSQPGAATVIHRRSRRRRRNKNDNDGNVAPSVLDPAVLDKVLRESHLPAAYSFEIQKTVQRIWQLSAQHVALQMPEGLLLYATVIADVLQRLCATATTAVATSADPSSTGAGPVGVPAADATGTTTTSLKVSILGDVTYGACCVDDLGAQALGADLLVHYGHSCLVPLQHTVIPCLYVFVEIQIDIPHLVDCLDTTLRLHHYQKHQQGCSITDPSTATDATTTETTLTTSRSMPHVYFLGTVQFRHALAPAMELLKQNSGCYADGKVSIPQVKPLSPGEVLGCTSPVLRDHVEHGDSEWAAAVAPPSAAAGGGAIVCFVADGRFHLESTMIANANAGITFYRYDPYSKQLSTESYDYPQMQKIRQEAIQRAKSILNGGGDGGRADHSKSDPVPVTVGIILGTLGRQGNPAIVKRIRQALHERFNDHQQQPHKKTVVRTFVLLLSEITPSKLQMLQSKVQLWIQVACPRLSIDWGHCFSSSQQKQVILLSPYEFFRCLEQMDDESNEKDIIQHDLRDVSSSYHPPMDFYSHSGGPWSNYYQENKDRQG